MGHPMIFAPASKMPSADPFIMEHPALRPFPILIGLTEVNFHISVSLTVAAEYLLMSEVCVR